MAKSRTRAKADKAESVGRKNLIINGGFDVWQRGTSFSGSAWTADRWRISTTDSSLTTAKTANRDEYNTLKVTMGGVSLNLDQRIEAFGNVGYNKPVTLSFWVRGSKALGTRCMLRNHTTASTLEAIDYDVTTSWTKVSKTFAASTAWSKDDVARLYLTSPVTASGWVSGDWFEFSNVQLELGSVATDFEHRSYGEELALCQRYFCHSGGDGVVPSLTQGPNYTHTHCLAVDIYSGGSVPSGAFPVEMRANPTITSGRLYTYNWAVYKNVTTASATKGGIWFIAHDGTYSEGTPYWYTYIADAEL